MSRKPKIRAVAKVRKWTRTPRTKMCQQEGEKVPKAQEYKFSMPSPHVYREMPQQWALSK